MPPGVPCAARKNAHCCETRAACCMLCVTMTIVTSGASSAIVSSTRRVEVGSSAEHGSSISSTSGSTASERAMHRRCCCPPDSAEPGWSSRSLTSSHSPPRRRQRSIRSARADRDDLHAGELQPGGHVVGDRHGRERVRLLEHHADAAAGLGDRDARASRCRCRRAAPRRPASPTATDSCIRLRMRRNVDLPQPDGPISAVTVFGGIDSDTRSSTLFVPNQAEIGRGPRAALRRRPRARVVLHRRDGRGQLVVGRAGRHRIPPMIAGDPIDRATLESQPSQRSRGRVLGEQGTNTRFTRVLAAQRPHGSTPPTSAATG